MNRQIAVWDRQAEEPTAARAAAWSEDSQRARFALALQYADPRPGESVLDWGCGWAALAPLLHPQVRYTGVDWSDAMLTKAARNIGPAGGPLLRSPERFFEYKSHADCVFCLGTWNLRLDWSLKQTGEELARLWRDHTRRILVASFYTGNDERCITYSANDLAASASVLSPRWLLDQWRDNDLMLVLTK